MKIFKKRKLLIIFVLAVLVDFLFPLNAQAFQPLPINEEAINLCRRTGGEIIEETVVGEWDYVKVSCLCPDGIKQSIFASEVENWEGCKVINLRQLIEIATFQAKTLFSKYKMFLLLFIVVIEIIWGLKRIKEKKISCRQLLSIFIFEFLIVVGFGVWAFGFGNEPPIILSRIYLNPFLLESFTNFIVKIGMDKSSLSFFLIFFTSLIFLASIFNFLVLLALLLLIIEFKIRLGNHQGHSKMVRSPHIRAK